MASFFDLEEQSLPGIGYNDPAQSELMAEFLREVRRPRTHTTFPPIQDPEQVKATLEQLRRNQVLGSVLAASGDKGLAGAGALLSRTSPEEYQRESARDEQVRRYQQWQADAHADEGNASSLARAMRALGSSGKALEDRSMSGSVQKELFGAADDFHNLGGLISSFDPAHQQVLGKYQSFLKNIPSMSVSNGLEGLLAKAADSDKGAIQQSALWWSEVNRLWAAKERYKLYGGTLTPGEAAAWEAIQLITPSTAPDIVQQRLQKVYEETLKSERKRARGAMRNYGRSRVEAYYGGDLDYGDNEGMETITLPGGEAGDIIIRRSLDDEETPDGYEDIE